MGYNPTKKIDPLKILYINVIECNSGWGAEWFINKGFHSLGHTTHCIDYRKHRNNLHQLVNKAPEYNIFFLQRGDNFPTDIIQSTSAPRLFWASELVSRCRDQDRLLTSGLFDHIFFHSEQCIAQAISLGWVTENKCSVLLNGFDKTIHRSIPEIQKDIDILFVGSMTKRRESLINKLQSYFKVTTVTAFGEKLTKLYNRAKIILNIHAENFKDTETRVFEALGCKAFLISERLSNDNPFSNDHFVQFDNLDDLCDKIKHYSANKDERLAIAVKGHAEAMAHHTYTHRAREIAKVMSVCLLQKKEKENTPIYSNKKSLKQIKDIAPNKPKQARPLRIFAAFSQTNWEDNNLQPALESFGEVVRFDWRHAYSQYDPKWHYGYKEQMNKELLNAVQKAHEEKSIHLFFSYLSGRLVFPGIIRAINMMKIPTLNISLDDKTKFYSNLEPTGFAGMADIASSFTLCLTSEKTAVSLYKGVGANAIYMPPGANPEIFRPYALPRDIDVCFIGQKYGIRDHLVNYLRKNDIHVKAYGLGWKAGELPVEKMVSLFSRSKIVLGIGTINDSSETVCIKGRDFEVPMSRGFYLTQYNKDLKDFFNIGKEIACYRTPKELVEKIRYYLTHQQEAEMIREAGFQRSIREHTWINRFKQAFKLMSINQSQERPIQHPSEHHTDDQATVNTSDNWTYYHRVGKNADSKKESIKNFVLSKKDVRFILDIGCNTGNISSQFMEYGIDVLGIDSSNNLKIADDYRFVQCDITKTNEIILNDCTFFLSLYHHILNRDGISPADDLFYKVLLRTKYLVFDSGNVHEKGKDRQQWINTQRKYFSSEKDLLDNFGIPYQIIGSWQTGDASRTIVVFEKNTFDESVEIKDEFLRKVGSSTQPEGLFSIKNIADQNCFFHKTRFYKLKLGNRCFFAKKHIQPDWESSELKNTIEIYRSFPKKELLTFYGLSKRFGFVYEWIDDIKYLNKLRNVKIHNVLLHDADLILTDGQKKYIDFWSDPDKNERKPEENLEEKTKHLLSQGENYFLANDFMNAKQCFMKILKTVPDHLEALNNLGVIAFQQGNKDKAISIFSKAISIDADYQEPIENIGKCLEENGKYKEALKWYKKLLDSGNRSVDIFNRTGNCLIHLENLKEAALIYKESLKLNQYQDIVKTILKEIEDMGLEV